MANGKTYGDLKPSFEMFNYVDGDYRMAL